jgi:hypothetical protein
MPRQRAQPLTVIAPNAAINDNGNLFKLSTNEEWYRIKTVELHRFPELQKPLERAWRAKGLFHKKFPTEKHVIERYCATDDASQRRLREQYYRTKRQQSRLQGDDTHSMSSQDDTEEPARGPRVVQNFNDEVDTAAAALQSLALQSPVAKKPVARRSNKAEFQAEFRPADTWLEHIAQFQHKKQQVKAVKRVHEEEQAFQCPCSAQCTAPRLPVYARDIHERLLAEPQVEALDPEQARRAKAALLTLANCQQWRSWIRGDYEVPADSDLGRLVHNVKNQTRSVGDWIPLGLRATLKTDEAGKLVLMSEDLASISSADLETLKNLDPSLQVTQVADFLPLRSLAFSAPGLAKNGGVLNLLKIKEVRDAVKLQSGVANPFAQLKYIL